MTASSVANRDVENVTSPTERAGMMEEHERSTNASASAGLNLNIFGALAGAFSGKSHRNTEADGSSVETREEEAHIRGAGAGNLKAVASAAAEEKNHHRRQAIQERSA